MKGPFSPVSTSHRIVRLLEFVSSILSQPATVRVAKFDVIWSTGSCDATYIALSLL